MSNQSFSLKSSLAINMPQNSFAKIKRLKIQESILFQNLKNHYPLNNQRANEICDCDEVELESRVEYYRFVSEIKKTYIELKKLFDEIMANTQSQETLKVVEIDDIKNNVFELENNIRLFKQYVQSELVKLKSAEIHLDEAINEKSVDIKKFTKQTKLHAMPYCEIVHSPVRVLINSPFKCTEVQQFQEFMMNSKSIYGGWNEFYHNAFVKIWHKYFSLNNTDNQEANDDDSDKFNCFLQELHQKLQEFTKEEIVSHHKWYSKYIYLKESQQRAIDKWKSNRMKLNKNKPLKDKIANGFSKKKIDSNIRINNDVRSNSINNLVSDELKHINSVSSDDIVKNFNDTSYENESLIKNITQFEEKKMYVGRGVGIQVLKPTEQWNNRCNNEYKVSLMCKNDLGNIKKLRKPSWRLGL